MARCLSRTGTISAGSKAFGDALEHYLVLEMRAYLSYARKRLDMRYWRSKSQFEVDLVIGEEVAIEVKATANPTRRDLRGLQALKEEAIFKDYYLVCTAAAPTEDR